MPENNSSGLNNRQITLTTTKENKKPTLLNTSYSKFIIPTALISYGIIARKSESLQTLDHSTHTHNEVSKHLKIKIPIDDYTQFAPTITVLDWALWA